MRKEEYTQIDRGDSVSFMSNLFNKHRDVYISQTFACKQGHLRSTYFSVCIGNYKFKLHINKNQRSFSNHGELVDCKN